MSNAKEGVIAGYPTKEEALAMWADLKDNDLYEVLGVNIGFGSFRPAEKCVAWVILRGVGREA